MIVRSCMPQGIVGLARKLSGKLLPGRAAKEAA